jgi:hypothetical protein
VREGGQRYPPRGDRPRKGPLAASGAGMRALWRGGKVSLDAGRRCGMRVVVKGRNTSGAFALCSPSHNRRRPRTSVPFTKESGARFGAAMM